MTDLSHGRIETVLGPIAPEALGPTLMHEHLLCNIVPPAKRGNPTPPEAVTLENTFDLNYGRSGAPKVPIQDKDVAIREVDWMKAAGGNAIVELTIGGLEPDPEGLRDIAKATGTHIVMGCGHYVHGYQDAANYERDIDSFATEMVDQVTKGLWGTDVKAGLIGEIGCESPWVDLEKRVMAGAIIAQRETGACVNVHPGRQEDHPMEVVEFFREHDGDLTRLIISHIDRTIHDDDRLKQLADTGLILEWDLFGQENAYYAPNPTVQLPNDAKRLRDIRMLIDRGHLDQIVISHDICFATRLQSYGGHGYGHIYRNVIPMMREMGWTEAEIDAVMVGNPRRLLTIQ